MLLLGLEELSTRAATIMGHIEQPDSKIEKHFQGSLLGS